MNATDANAHAPGRAAPAQAPDMRLQQLKAELDDHARIGRYLGVDFQRAVSALGDGYPDTAVACVGKITERLLKQLWIHHGAPGTPAGKTLRDLIRGCRPYIRSQRVLDALHEIQRLRNRASHDGYPVAAEDGLVAIRRLLDVLDWYTSTGSGALTRHAPRLAPAAAAKAGWLAGLYLTLDYRLASRQELSRHAVYLLFTRERGLLAEHAELLICRDAGEAAQALDAAGPGLLRAGLPRLTRILVLDDDAGGRPDRLPAGCQVVTYDRFMDVFADATPLARPTTSSSGRPPGEFRDAAGYWLADYSFLQGQFSQALSNLDQLTDDSAELSGEILRLHGHVHRVNAPFDQPEARYRQALDLARQTANIAAEGKA